ncbi:CAP-Gly domain-containing linker protein 1 isoform X2 [Episyrphus balteatus]|uniref:CAP-Gly domain-containing linker protein 1 isoform X2 n=1 Tax=Episyrphus balteatus TaxID=286459 RepID=UPI0024863185|nr:CAP-Gly domain-containing linker protein 1 isoform X2 [Episyrphus balteatus]
MDSLKPDSEKNSKLQTKIPSTPKTSLKNSGIGDSSNSKIPTKREVSKTSTTDSKNVIRTKTKKQEVTSSSVSLMNLKLPKPSSLPSTRSCFNSHRSVQSKEQTPRFQSSDKISEISKKAEMASFKRKLQSYEAAKEKLQNSQEHFMSKYNLVKDELPKEDRDVKLICVFKNNEGHLITRNQTSKVIVTCDKKSLEELKSSWKNFAQQKFEMIDTLDSLTSSPREIGDTFVKEHGDLKLLEEVKNKLKIERQQFLDDFIKQIEKLQASDKPKEPSSNKEHETEVKTLLEEVNTLKKNLEESQTELNKSKKIYEQKCSIFKKEIEEKTKNQSKKQKEFEELKKKYDCLENEHSNTKAFSKEVSEKLSKKTHEWEEFNQKLKISAHKNVNLETKNKELELVIDKLQTDLKVAMNSGKDSIRDQTLKLTNEINVLKNQVMAVQKEKEIFENESKSLKNEIIKLQKIESKCLELQDQVTQANKDKLNLNQTIRDLEAKLQISQNQVFVSKDVQEELKRLQTAEDSNNEKIKTLEQDLIKAQFQVKKLEEKIVLDGKLLKVRTELIDSLQKKEHSQKVRLTDLFAEVGEKNNDLQLNSPFQIKTEILTKTEEFQNLFSTLSAKQIELTRQEHMIKLLQENNERAQKLRVRQEAKIAKLEEEIFALKNTISVYQDAVIPNNTLRRNLAIVEASRDAEFTDSLGFYVEERRKKRHIDISVKKYEK